MHLRRFVVGKPAVTMTALFILSALLATTIGIVTHVGAAPAAKGSGVGPVEVTKAVHSDVSPPLLSITPLKETPPATGKKDHHKIDQPVTRVPNGNKDGARQAATGPLVSTTPGLGFAGVGNGDYGFTPNGAPPDTEGVVGATQYVQWVNESFAVFNKSTGALVYGPAAGNTIWSGFGGVCQTNNDGDPIAQYDKAAGRWVMTQFSVTNGTSSGFRQCVAISTTSDATGSWYRYSFNYGTNAFND